MIFNKTLPPVHPLTDLEAKEKIRPIIESACVIPMLLV